MAWYRDLRLRPKLLLAFGLVLGLVALQSLTALRTAGANAEAVDRVEHTLVVIETADDTLLTLTAMQSAYRGYLLTGRTGFLDPYRAGDAAFPRHLADLRELTAGDPAQLARWDDLEARAARWQAEITAPGIALREAVDAGEAPVADVLAFAAGGGGDARFAEIRTTVAAAIETEQRSLDAYTDRAHEQEDRLRRSILVGSAGTILLSVLVAGALSRDVAGEMGRMATAAQALAGGDLSRRLAPRRRDEVGQTAAAFDRMADRVEGLVDELRGAVRAARESEARARAVTDGVAEGIVTFDPRGAVVAANPAAGRIFGAEPADLVGTDVRAVLPGAAPFLEGGDDGRDPGTGELAVGTPRETWGRRADGGQVPLELVVSRLRLDGERRFVGVVRDVTERREAQAALAQERDLLHTLMDNIPEPIYFKDDASRFLRVNRAHAELLGLADPLDAVGTSDGDYYPASLANGFRAKEIRILATGQALVNHLERQDDGPDGERWTLTTKVPFRDPAGQVIGLVGNSRDVSGLKRAEAALRRSEERFAKAFRANPVGVCITTLADGRLVEVNDRFVDLLRFDREEVIGHTTTELGLWATDPTGRDAVIRALKANGAVRDQEIRIATKGGSPVDLLLSMEQIELDGEPCILSLFFDVTARKRAEEALRRNEEQNRALLNAVPDLLFRMGRDGTYRDVRTSREQDLLQPPAELVGKRLDEVLPPALAERSRRAIEDALETGEVQPFEYELTLEGRSRWFESRTVPCGSDEVLSIVRDVTERRQAEAALRESEGRARKLFAAAERQARELALLDEVRTALARHLDMPTVFRTVVEATAQIFGYPQVGLYTREGVGGDELVLQHQVGYDVGIARLPTDRGVIGRVARTGESALLEDVGRDPDFVAGMDGTTSEVCVPLFDEDRVVGVFNAETTGAPLGQADLRLMVAVSEQITIAIGRARLFREAQESGARFRSAFGNAPIGIALVGTDGRWLQVNRSLCDLVGYGEEELRGLTFQDLTHPDDLEADLGSVRRMLAGEIRSYQMEKRYLHKEGHVIWALLSVSLVHDEHGAPRYFVAQIQDITERKAALAALHLQVRAAERARAETSAVLDAAGEAMVLIAPDGRIVSANRRFGEFFAVETAAVADRPMRAFRRHTARVFGDDYDRVRGLLAGGLDDAEGRLSEVVTQCWPEPRELALTAAPVRDGEQEHLGRLYAFRDVTHERAVDRMKTEFVSLVSHELRTPLTSIKGYVDLLLEGEVGELEAEQREFLEIVGSNAQRLVALINDLLDISRIESGKVGLTRAPQDLARLIGGVVTSLRPQLEAKGQALTVEVDPGLPAVLGDADRLAQVLTNLLSNAHKYTPAGGRIGVAARAEGGVVRVEVRDTGIGLFPEEQAQLFQKFFRARNRTTQEVGGTGLGLAITRSLVEMHGGRITVESAPGAGSTFAFTVPLAREGTGPLAAPVAVPAAGARILVVEDEPDIAGLVRRYLERAGHAVTVARDGPEALALARETRPDLITLDVLLPGADGFAVLEWLKGDEATRAIPVMLLSMLPDEGQGRRLGAVDYLVKPVHERALLTRVGRLLARRQPGLVLVADDDPDGRRLIAGHLRRAGYGVVEAGDGAEAVALARRHRFDLMLLDVKMPGTDGIAALRALRAEASTRDCPVVVMTGSPGVLEAADGPGSPLGGLGVTWLLRKPFSAEELAEAIADELGRGTGRAGAAGREEDGPVEGAA